MKRALNEFGACRSFGNGAMGSSPTRFVEVARQRSPGSHATRLKRLRAKPLLYRNASGIGITSASPRRSHGIGMGASALCPAGELIPRCRDIVYPLCKPGNPQQLTVEAAVARLDFCPGGEDGRGFRGASIMCFLAVGDSGFNASAYMPC